MNKRSFRPAILSVSVLIGMLLGACSDNGGLMGGNENDGKPVKIGVSHCCSTSDLYMNNVFKTIEKQGGADPLIEMKLLRANENQQVQVRQVDKLIADGIQALLLAFVVDNDPEHKHYRTLLQKAKNANIPVVLYVIHADETTFSQFDNAYFVGSIAPQSGIYQGELIIDGWTENPVWDKNGDNTIQYAILKGPDGNPDAEARTKWVQGTIENYPGKGISAERLDLVSAKWRRDKAKEVVLNWLNGDIGDKLELIIANNDDMAVGAVEALQVANISLPVTGVDAIPDALKAVKDGKMLGTVQQNAQAQALEALNLAVNLATGRSLRHNTEEKVVGRELMVPYVSINQDNVKDFIQ